MSIKMGDPIQSIQEGQDLLTLAWLWQTAHSAELSDGQRSQLGEMLASLDLSGQDSLNEAFGDLVDFMMMLQSDPDSVEPGALLEVSVPELEDRGGLLLEWLLRTRAHAGLVDSRNFSAQYANSVRWEELRGTLEDGEGRRRAVDALIQDVAQALQSTGYETPVSAELGDTRFVLQDIEFDTSGWIKARLPRVLGWTPTPGLRAYRDLTYIEDGYRFLAEDLSDFPVWSSLRGQGARKIFEAANRLFQVLSRLHSQGVYHLTLSPSTVYLVPGVPVLSDYFWTVVSAAEILPAKYPPHALRWAAPEAEMGRPVPSSDYFSLAWLMIDVLGGHSHTLGELEKLGLDKDQVHLLVRLTEPVEARADAGEIEALFRATKRSDPLFTCRVCGREHDFLPWGPRGDVPSYRICDCCGVEFGQDDADLGEMLDRRKNWVAQGGPWFDPAARPPDWNLEQQIKNVPDDWRLEYLIDDH